MRWIALVLFGIAATAIPAAAQDIPGRVGRLAYLEGSAGAYHDPQIGWEQAFVNSPITSENSVWTEPGARAELQLGGTAVRLDGATQLDISRLDDLVFDAAVVRGSVGLRVRYKQRDDRYVISTPQARFLIDTDGRYRIDVAPENDESRLTVFSGTAHLDGAGGRVRVDAGRSVVVYGASSQYVFDEASTTRFDRWAFARDDQWRDTVSRRYVSPYMTGYEDLDRYGEWIRDSDYGALWVPSRVAYGWAPYRHGDLCHIRPGC